MTGELSVDLLITCILINHLLYFSFSVSFELYCREIDLKTPFCLIHFTVNEKLFKSDPYDHYAAYFLHFFFSDPSSHLCTHDQRNPFCPDIYDPVCALIKGHDNDSQIATYYEKTLGNACAACSASTVVGLVPGECRNENVTICTKDKPPVFCPDIYDPVCTFTYRHNRKTPIQAVTRSNSCTGCGVAGARFHTPVIATSWIPRYARKTNEMQRDAIHRLLRCAYYLGNGCQEDLCQKREASYCNACADPHVLYTWTLEAFFELVLFIPCIIRNILVL